MHKNSLRYESLLDICGNLEDSWHLSTVMRSSEEKEADKSKTIENKNKKNAYIYFLSLLLLQIPDNFLRTPEWEAFLTSKERFSEHFCWPMELVLALGILGFILINPLNFRPLSLSSILNVLRGQYRGKATHFRGRALVNKNRTDLKSELFHRERPNLNALQLIQ